MNRAALILAAVSMAAGTGSATAQPIGVATSNPGSIYHSSGSTIAKVANDKASLRATVQPFASPNVYIPAIDAGEIEFGLANVYELSLAVEGKAHFEGRAHRNLRAVFIMYPLRVGVFVRKDAEVHAIADLKGRAMPDGYTSQKILLPIIDAEYATAGLSRADMKPVRVPNVVGGANEFIAGKVEGFLFAIGAAKVKEADAAVGGLRMLPLENTAANLAAVRKFLPLAYLRPIAPGAAATGVIAPTHVVAYDALVFANADTPEDIVYRMVKAMHDNKKDLAAAFGPFNLFDPDRMAKSIEPISYHPGAIKYYQEIGQWPPK